jgi:hypothetical protein
MLAEEKFAFVIFAISKLARVRSLFEKFAFLHSEAQKSAASA